VEVEGTRAYPPPSTARASAVMRRNRKRDTRPELLLRSALYRRGLRYRVQGRVSAGAVVVRPDLVFGSARTVVFVDGCFWHGCPEHGTLPRRNAWYWQPKIVRNQRRDALVNDALQLAGWSVVRVWEHEEPEAAAARIAAVLGR
jgi:DNA mismatch endonuclease (patch repair protein)